MIKKTIPIERAVAIAVEMHQSGQLARAEAMYVEILHQDPGNVDAMHLLGVLANQGGRPDVAIQLIRRALARKPHEAVIHFNLAEAYSANLESSLAVEEYLKAIEIVPDYFDARNNLANTYVEMEKFDLAIESAMEALKIEADHPLARNNLGNALRGKGLLVEAGAQYELALKQRPDQPAILNNYGLVLANIGHPELGVMKLKEAIRLDPSLVDAYSNLGLLLNNIGKRDEAINVLETAIKLNPKQGNAYDNLGLAFRGANRHQDAYDVAKKAVELLPESAGAWSNFAGICKELGKADEALIAIDKAVELKSDSGIYLFARANILRDLNKPDEAIVDLRKADELLPGRSDILSVLGYALQERGELDEALESLNKSILLAADPQTHSNVMMVMCYHPNVFREQHFEAHRAYAKVHEDPHKPNWRPHENDRNPDRRLRIGYFSPDLRGHVVSHFTNPIFENHNHDGFEIYAYSNHYLSDATTIMQRAKIDHWRETVGQSFETSAEMIRADRIDILVELAGHTALNGLPVMALKPAPIQVNAIGFPSTTGLSAIDYRVTDRLCDPPGIAEAYNSEKLLHMPDCFWCYQPPDLAPPVGSLPADQNEYVTFLSVNNFTKVTPQVLSRWAQILAVVPRSKLVMQTSGLASDFVRGRVRTIFESHGIVPDRIEMRTMRPMHEYLQLLETCDIMLDPFPFNGGTTTCHGLWMGLPVVSLTGLMHAGRMGLSMLSCIGLPELCGDDEEAYVHIATGLANDLPRLRTIRAGMRDRLLASPLLDAPNYVRNLESAYRRIWKEWCSAS